MSTSIIVATGSEVLISCPLNIEAGTGYFAKQAEGLIRGFKLSNPNVGSIYVNNEDPRCSIRYRHEAIGDNVITFTSVGGDTGYIYIHTMPAHSHDSAGSGGPAFAVYSSDFKE